MRPTSCHYRLERSKGRFNGKVRAANESYARKMNIITIITHFYEFTFNVIGCIVRIYGFNCTFMYVHSEKFEYFGHWLSDVNTLQIKDFDTHSVFICKTFNYKPKISVKPQNTDLISAGCKYICGPAKFHLQPCQTYVWPAK